MQLRGWAIGLTVLAAAATFGCGQQSGPPAAKSAGAVAVIDLDAIARRLGSDKQITDSINQRQTALNQKLVELAKSYNAQIAERQKALAPTDAKQGDVQLAAWQQQANASLNEVKQRAAADLQSHRAQLVTQFREQIKPIARRIAQQRGLSVIVTKNDSVLYDYTAGADITEAVYNELVAVQPAMPLASAPAATTDQSVQ